MIIKTNYICLALIGFIIAGFCCVPAVHAQDDAAVAKKELSGTAAKGVGEVGKTANTEIEIKSMTFKEILKSGGKVMYVLAGLSVLTVALVMYFAIVLRIGQIAPIPLHREVVEKIKIGSTDDARRACEYRSSPLSSVVLSALDYMHDIPEVDPSLLKDIIEGEGSRQSESIQGQTQYLLDIAVVSPMVGLLGTVFGMMKAFSAVAYDIAKAKPIVLAAGVSQALITTAFGLIVGITAMIFYAIFRRRASRLVSSLETASADVLTAIMSRKSHEFSNEI